MDDAIVDEPIAVQSNGLAQRSLDPFGFFGTAASRIAGLGGAAPSPVADYAFHTSYTPLARGTTRFTVRFEGLRATTGTLALQINLQPQDFGAHARVVSLVRLPLAALANEGGVVEIAAEGFSGVGFAVVGAVVGDSDAVADSLAITLDPDETAPFAETFAQARTGWLAADPADPLAPLFDASVATLAEPLSQACTASQFDEPDYAKWLARLGQGRHNHRKQWEFIYILQVLERFGMLRPGRRGIGFGVGRELLPALMAAMGAEVVATDLPPDHADLALWNPSGQHSAAIEGLHFPSLCDEATLRARVSFRAVDMTHIPADLAGFDYSWSSCAYEHLGSIEAGLAFVEASIGCLRPGGIAVHTTELNLTSNRETIDDHATVLFRRRDMERLALRLIAAGHDVAPIRLDIGDSALDSHVDVPPYANDPHLKMALGRFATTSFGMIVRAGSSASGRSEGERPG